jgi:hypothetical protein
VVDVLARSIILLIARDLPCEKQSCLRRPLCETEIVANRDEGSAEGATVPGSTGGTLTARLSQAVSAASDDHPLSHWPREGKFVDPALYLAKLFGSDDTEGMVRLITAYLMRDSLAVLLAAARP